MDTSVPSLFHPFTAQKKALEDQKLALEADLEKKRILLQAAQEDAMRELRSLKQAPTPT